MLAIWLPSVFLGVVANHARNVPAIESKLEARERLTTLGPTLSVGDRDSLRRAAAGDDVILRLVEGYAPTLLSALLAAAVMAAVMASDSQILALSTMFAADVFAFYGGTRRFGDAAQVRIGRLFVIALTVVAYLIALRIPQSIFDLATQYSFAGYAALSPLLVAALFWTGSTKWGALASTVWTAAAVATVAVVQTVVPVPATGAGVALLSIGGVDIVTRATTGLMVGGLLPVVPMTIGSALLMVIVSRLTPSARPARATLLRYFPADNV